MLLQWLHHIAPSACTTRKCSTASFRVLETLPQRPNTQRSVSGNCQVLRGYRSTIPILNTSSVLIGRFDGFVAAFDVDLPLTFIVSAILRESPVLLFCLLTCVSNKININMKCSKLFTNKKCLFKYSKQCSHTCFFSALTLPFSFWWLDSFWITWFGCFSKWNFRNFSMCWSSWERSLKFNRWTTFLSTFCVSSIGLAIGLLACQSKLNNCIYCFIIETVFEDIWILTFDAALASWAMLRWVFVDWCCFRLFASNTLLHGTHIVALFAWFSLKWMIAVLRSRCDEHRVNGQFRLFGNVHFIGSRMPPPPNMITSSAASFVSAAYSSSLSAIELYSQSLCVEFL